MAQLANRAWFLAELAELANHLSFLAELAELANEQPFIGGRRTSIARCSALNSEMLILPQMSISLGRRKQFAGRGLGQLMERDAHLCGVSNSLAGARWSLFRAR